MKHSIIGIYNGTDFISAVPYIYDEGAQEWKIANAYIRDTTWKSIGGAGVFYIPLLTAQSLEYNSTDKILVKEYKRNRIIDSTNQALKSYDGYYLILEE